MSFTSMRWYTSKMFKHVITEINRENDLNTLSVYQIRLLRKRLYLVKDRLGLLYMNFQYYYFAIIILDAIGLIIAFYSVVAFGFKTRMSLMLLYSLIMLTFKLTSAWFISEVPDQVINNN